MLKRKIRRRYLWYFKPTYVIRQLHDRKGTCKNCSCCGKPNHDKCKYLDVNGLCTIYNNRPFDCMFTPIDEMDKSEFGKINCGYYWGEKK